MLSTQLMTQDSMTMLSEGTANPGSSVSDATADAVSSLRALALSTMRLKRRRDSQQQPVAGPSRPSYVPQRPSIPIADVEILDYGSEEQPDGQPTNDANPTKATPEPTNVITISKDDSSKDSSMGDGREEGEISDEEGTVTPLPTSTVTQNQVITESKPTSLPFSLSREPPPPVPDTISRPSSVLQSSTNWNNWVPQPDQVRPGLKMNMEQFNLAKELVLDLLGWGVSPEYLVDCGLTREAVFYSFTELNLRLPKNLDVSGLVPLRSSSSSCASSQTTPSVNSPPVPATPPDSHESRDVTPSITKSSEPQTASATPITADLNEMEARRKLELLARKAVLASRKKKALQTTAEPIGAPSISAQNTLSSEASGSASEESSVAPTDAVDNFLKSMIEDSILPSPLSVTPSQETSSSSSSKIPTQFIDTKTTPIPVNEVVMSDIPGLGSLRAETTPSSGLATPEVLPTTIQSNRVSEQDLQGPSTIVKNQTKSSDSSDSSYQSSVARNVKRGTKRPVAMDFVEDGRYAHGTSRRASPPLLARPAIRRKVGGFAGLGGIASYRCVINLSDSEDESSEVNVPERISSGSVIRTDPKLVGLQKYVQEANFRPASAPIVVKPSAPSTPTPESLMEKEEKIRRMREHIAQIELKRLKKAAESRLSTNTPTLTSQTAISTEMSVDNPIQVSELPDTLSPEQETSARSEPLTPLGDEAEEAAVLQDLMNGDSKCDSVSSTPPDTKLALPEDVGNGSKDVEMMPDNTENQVVEDSDLETSPIDAVPMVSSVEAANTLLNDSANFLPYSSPFHSYPLLRSRARVASDYVSQQSPDLRPLRVAIALRETNDTGRRICQYEIPGGGTCHDKTCTDVHLADFEPDDHELARYLLECIPALRKFGQPEIVEKMTQARQRTSSKTVNPTATRTPTTSVNSLESTVADVLAALTGAG